MGFLGHTAVLAMLVHMQMNNSCTGANAMLQGRHRILPRGLCLLVAQILAIQMASFGVWIGLLVLVCQCLKARSKEAAESVIIHKAMCCTASVGTGGRGLLHHP